MQLNDVDNDLLQQSTHAVRDMGALAARATAALLAACGGGTSVGATTSAGTRTVPLSLSSTGLGAAPITSDEEAARFLLQAQFSASDAEIATLRSTSYAAWLNTQFAAPMGPTG